MGILELLSRYDPVLEDHLNHVKVSQILGNRLQVHYLSPEVQNEFIRLHANEVIQTILNEREMAK